jgi:hypothetical protein
VLRDEGMYPPIPNDSQSPVLVLGDGQFEMVPGLLVRLGRSPTATVTIGRNDPALSRTALQFYALSGAVQALNAGNIPVSLSIEGGTYLTLSPGSGPQPLPTGCRGTVLIRAGTDHEIGFSVQGSPAAGPPSDPDLDDKEPTTANLTEILGLHEREILVLAAFAEPRLLDRRLDKTSIPTSASVAERFGMTMKELEKVIDSLAVKLTRYVPGLLGSNAGRARYRRQLMVSYALDHGIVIISTLKALPSRS